MALYRYVPVWSGFQGSPGYTIVHFESESVSSLQTSVNALRTFFNALASYLPTDVTISFPGEAAEIDVATGTLVGVQAVTSPSAVAGTDTGAYSAPNGIRVRWLTDRVLRGRRVTGSSFIVPAANSAFFTDGTPSGTAVGAIQTAANTFVTATGGDFHVYSKPPASNPSGGVESTVVGASVPDRSAVLRSRRD